MEEIVLTEQICCPWCRHQFTGIVRFTNAGRPYIICVNSQCGKLIMGDELQVTVGPTDTSTLQKLAAGKWPSQL